MAENEGVEEWTLCLGRRDAPGSVQSESEEGEKGTEECIEDMERGEEAEESRPWEDETSPEENSPKDRKTKISNKARRQTSSTIETTTLDHICRRRN